VRTKLWLIGSADIFEKSDEPFKDIDIAVDADIHLVTIVTGQIALRAQKIARC
jgi:hypothetical protein